VLLDATVPLLLDHVATGSDPADLRSLAIELIERVASA
jgi:hypothetical protein